MSVVSVATWNYLNPFFQPNDDSGGEETTWAGDSGDDDFSVSDGTSTEPDSVAEGVYDSPRSSEPKMPKSVRKNKKIVLRAKSAPATAPRRPDAPGIMSKDSSNYNDKKFVGALSGKGLNTPEAKSSLNTPTVTTQSKEKYASRFVGWGLPKAPSMEYELDESQFVAKYDLPRPPSLVYEYLFVSERK
jgi:hypothetical protein